MSEQKKQIEAADGQSRLTAVLGGIFSTVAQLSLAARLQQAGEISRLYASGMALVLQQQ